MLKLLRISGDSLAPALQDGDFVLVSKIPILFLALRPGDVVAFKHPEYGTMIKQIEQLDARQQKIYVVGNHPLSVDSRRFGPVRRADVIGKMIWHIRKSTK